MGTYVYVRKSRPLCRLPLWTSQCFQPFIVFVPHLMFLKATIRLKPVYRYTQEKKTRKKEEKRSRQSEWVCKVGQRKSFGRNGYLKHYIPSRPAIRPLDRVDKSKCASRSIDFFCKLPQKANKETFFPRMLAPTRFSWLSSFVQKEFGPRPPLMKVVGHIRDSWARPSVVGRLGSWARQRLGTASTFRWCPPQKWILLGRTLIAIRALP